MHNNSLFSWKEFDKNPIVGILRGYTTKSVEEIIKYFFVSGFYTVEVTMNSPKVLDTIIMLRNCYPELNVGAGTVCSVRDLNLALDAGAQFIVTPILEEEIIKTCVALGIPIFPGAYTPTEIYKAWELGADMVKVFPATQLGPGFIKDLKGPLNNIKLLPTGGVSKQNISSFFKAGSSGVGMGSSLFDKKMIEEKDFISLENHFKAVKACIKN